MNSHSCNPINAEETIAPSNRRGAAIRRRTSSVTRVHSFAISMNTVIQGIVSSMRQPKISRPLSGESSEV